MDNNYLEISLGYHGVIRTSKITTDGIKFGVSLGHRFLEDSTEIAIRNQNSELIDKVDRTNRSFHIYAGIVF